LYLKTSLGVLVQNITIERKVGAQKNFVVTEAIGIQQRLRRHRVNYDDLERIIFIFRSASLIFSVDVVANLKSSENCFVFYSNLTAVISVIQRTGLAHQ